jgi:hypothetical protein
MRKMVCSIFKAFPPNSTGASNMQGLRQVMKANKLQWGISQVQCPLGREGLKGGGPWGWLYKCLMKRAWMWFGVPRRETLCQVSILERLEGKKVVSEIILGGWAPSPELSKTKLTDIKENLKNSQT